MRKYYIKAEDWQRIYGLLKCVRGVRVQSEEVTRCFVEGVYFMMRTGCQWRELPEVYGKWRSVHKRYESWCRKMIWNQILESLSKDFDDQSVMIDATIVRAHPCAAGYEKGQHDREALGRSKGGFTTKIHAVVDGLGQALRFTLTPGQRHDITQASWLLENFKGTHVLADKGYDSNSLIEQLETQNCTPVIPPRSNRKNPRNYDKHIYKERHLVECFFNKIKHFRRVFSRFDKKSSSYMGFLAYASIIIWLR